MIKINDFFSQFNFSEYSMSRKMFLNQQDVHKLVMCVNYYQIIQAA